MLAFTDSFRKNFDREDEALVSAVHDKYFSGLIAGTVKVGYTSNPRVWGIADADTGSVRFNRISPHTVAHELMHIAQHDRRNGIPEGERSCDVFTCALGEEVCDNVSYLRTHGATPDVIHQVCKEAVANRENGMRNYIVWAESEFKRRMSGKGFWSVWTRPPS